MKVIIEKSRMRELLIKDNPYPFGTIEYFKWNDFYFKILADKNQEEYKAKREFEKILKSINYGHKWNGWIKACHNCGITEIKYVDQKEKKICTKVSPEMIINLIQDYQKKINQEKINQEKINQEKKNEIANPT